MRKVIISLAFVFCFSPLYAISIELIEPEGLGRTGSVPRGDCCMDPIPVRGGEEDSIIMYIIPIITDSATSDVFQPFTFRITSENSVDWSTLTLWVVTHGGT